MARLNYLYKLLWNIEIGKPAVGGGRMWNPRSLRPLPSPFRETDVTVTRDLKLVTVSSNNFHFSVFHRERVESALCEVR